jgi:hypothetical protein
MSMTPATVSQNSLIKNLSIMIFYFYPTKLFYKLLFLFNK